MTNKEITRANLERVKQLLTDVQGMSPEQWQKTLDSMVRFHRYSMCNQWILMLQNCSQVAGFKQWKDKYGRTVKKGARAAWIFAPRFTNKVEIDEETKEETTSRVLSGFLSVPVFDIRDTEGKAIQRGMTSKAAVKLDTLKGLAKDLKCKVTFKSLEVKKGGCYHDNEITLNSNLSEAENVGTLIHEIAHHLLNHQGNDSDITRSLGEQQAETVTYLACNILGVERKSEFYLKSWGLSKDIMKDFQEIDRASRKILAGLETN